MACNRARSVCSWVLFTARLSSEAEVALDNDNDNDNKEFICTLVYKQICNI